MLRILNTLHVTTSHSSCPVSLDSRHSKILYHTLQLTITRAKAIFLLQKPSTWILERRIEKLHRHPQNVKVFLSPELWKVWNLDADGPSCASSGSLISWNSPVFWSSQRLRDCRQRCSNQPIRALCRLGAGLRLP